MPVGIVWADSITHCADGPGSPIRRTLAAGPHQLDCDEAQIPALGNVEVETASEIRWLFPQHKYGMKRQGQHLIKSSIDALDGEWSIHILQQT